MNFMDVELANNHGEFFAVGDGFNFQLKNITNIDFIPSSGDVTIGVRPSILSLVDEGIVKNSLTLPIKVCENIGSQTVLISDINSSRVAVEVESS